MAKGTAREVVDLYEAKARETMSKALQAQKKDAVKKTDTDLLERGKEHHFYVNPEYMQLTDHAREGSGEATVCNVEFLSEEESPLHMVDDIRTAIVRMSILFHKDCQICIGYHIRDDKNNPVLGSNTLYEGIGEIAGKAGDKLVAEFHTQIPLREGRYNIMTVLSTAVFADRTVKFVDITKDGIYFDVLEKKPYRIWNAVQLPNSVKVRKICN